MEEKKQVHSHTHTHTLEDGTVVTHSHTHSHTHTKAVLNRLSRAIGHLESIRRIDSAFGGEGSNQQYRKSHSSGSY